MVRGGAAGGGGMDNFEYGDILEFLRLLLHIQRNPGMDARIRRHCARMHIASDAWHSKIFMQ